MAVTKRELCVFRGTVNRLKPISMKMSILSIKLDRFLRNLARWICGISMKKWFMRYMITTIYNVYSIIFREKKHAMSDIELIEQIFCIFISLLLIM